MKVTPQELASKREEIEALISESKKDLNKIEFLQSLADAMTAAGGTPTFEDGITLSALAGILATNNIRFTYVPPEPDDEPELVQTEKLPVDIPDED